MLLRDKRIFIVEDDANNRFIMQAMLEEHGALVEFERVQFNTLALRLNQLMPVHAILMDLMLPKVDGFTLFKQIRQNQTFDAVPIVAVSASEASIAMTKAREAGFAGFIAKPIHRISFAQYIARIINGENVWAGGG
jgi:two-component system, cell cycle response regulator DivK